MSAVITVSTQWMVSWEEWKQSERTGHWKNVFKCESRSGLMSH
jgi:hypothetical protein